MTIVKDFKELHIGLKTGILTILFQIPFFFIAIYLFDDDLIQRISDTPCSDMDFWFLGCLCFCFSLIWFFLNIACTFITIAITDKILDTTSTDSEQYTASLVYSIFYLCTAIVIGYYFDISIKCFLIGAYSFIIIRILWVLLWSFITRTFS